jgi:DNA-binding CsgD family transcriptional regulator
MDWLNKLNDQDIQSVLNKDALMIYNQIGRETFCELLDSNLLGLSLYMPKSIIVSLRKQYIKKTANSKTLKQIAIDLNITERQVYRYLKKMSRNDKDRMDK